MMKHFKALVSSDWNECLAPCGPFDCISFAYPHLAAALTAVFRQYTGNRISLGQAAREIQELLPAAITADQMDAYIDGAFSTYSGVPELIEWCLNHDILFMINTTGMIGYFQRIFAKHLLPRVPVLSAHPMIRYPEKSVGIPHVYELHETLDKAGNSAEVLRSQGIPAEKAILLGDSGGDGPHFEWGASAGACLIGSMTKPSLDTYCRKKNIKIHLRFGLDYSRREKVSLREEMQINFLDLADTIDEIIRG